jgi:hypothetical protein
LKVPKSAWLLHDTIRTLHDNNPRPWSMPEFLNVPVAPAFQNLSRFTVLDLTAAPGVSASEEEQKMELGQYARIKCI